MPTTATHVETIDVPAVCGSRTWECRLFDSVHECVEYAMGAPSGCQMDNSLNNPDWIGRDDLGTTRRGIPAKVDAAWPEGLAVIDGILRELRESKPELPMSRRRVRQWRPDDGDDICQDRLRAGQDFWRATPRLKARGPNTITLLVGVSASSHRKAEDVFWRGAAAACLVDMLEDAGYRVEVWCTELGSGAFVCGSNSFLATRVKAAQDSIDIATLVNAISPWFFRTILFGCICNSPSRKYCSSLGTPVDINSPEAEPCRNLIDPASEAVFTIDGVWNRADSIALVQGIINQINGREEV